MKALPHDLEAEECIIGAMLLSTVAVDAMKSTLLSSDFYRPLHAILYDTAIRLREKGRPVDAVTVMDALKQEGLADTVENPGVLVGLMANVPSIATTPHYAKIVLDHSLRRRIITEAHGLIDQAYDLASDPSGVLEDHQAIMATLGTAIAGNEPDDMAVEEFIEQYKDNDPLAKWVVYGLLRKRHKLMLVGGESHGKSVLMRYIAICAAYGVHPFRHTAQKPIRTLLVDLENPSDALSESFEMILKPVVKEALYDVQPVNRIWWRPAGIDLRSRVDVAQLENVIRARRPELVCLGPMYCAFESKSNELWETPARQVQAVLKQLMVRYDFALILEDHAPQADSSGKRPMRPYGSSFWRRWLDIGIGMEPIGETVTSFELNQWKKRVGTDWPKYIERGDAIGSPWPWVGRWE